MDRDLIKHAAAELLRTDGRQWNAVSDGMLGHVIAKLGDQAPLDDLGLDADVAFSYATGVINNAELPEPVRTRLSQIASYDDPKAEPKLIVAVAYVIQGRIASRPETDSNEFEPVVERAGGTATVAVRAGQARFRMRVLQRYGLGCAVCELTALPLLDAAHVVPFKQHGTDDPRNGLVLCSNHHKALDQGLIAIDPDSYAIVATGPFTLDELGVTRDDLSHLPARPHEAALRLRWP